jgi:polysaccharide pyruvyl transferase WcaK-like protein
MKVLVYGWYHQGNIGDDLFMEAYHHLFPSLQLVFTEAITSDKLQDVDAVFLGGGSFLLDAPRATDEALQLLKKKKIFYLGVGVESEIHPTHEMLMRRAQLVAIRSSNQLDRVRQINHNTILIPDLVYALKDKASLRSATSNSVLVLPNVAVLPNNGDAHWKQAAWIYFKSEFTQFLDWLVDNKFLVKFLPMCMANKEDDTWVATELTSFMKYRSNRFGLTVKPQGISEVLQLISQHSIVITQRFHGIVLAELAGVPYIAIHHHDKLKQSSSNAGKFISYYGLSKQKLIDEFNIAISANYTSILPIETNIFKALVEEVLTLL